LDTRKEVAVSTDVFGCRGHRHLKYLPVELGSLGRECLTPFEPIEELLCALAAHASTAIDIALTLVTFYFAVSEGSPIPCSCKPTARQFLGAQARMLNPYNECWEARGLFVIDGAGLPSQGAQNPTLTLLALTARACANALRITRNRSRTDSRCSIGNVACIDQRISHATRNRI
jgi:GMC oxidoreductase